MRAADQGSGAGAHCSRQQRLLAFTLGMMGSASSRAIENMLISACLSPERQTPPARIPPLDDGIVPKGCKHLVPDADAPRAHQQVARLDISAPVCQPHGHAQEEALGFPHADAASHTVLPYSSTGTSRSDVHICTRVSMLLMMMRYGSKQ